MANAHARVLRKTMTRSEVRLWLLLRQLRPQGLHFRRQVPLANSIVDFACLSAWLVVELDGEQHGLPEGLARDARRDAAKAGFRVLRFWNQEVIMGIDDVAGTIWRAAVERLSPSGAARHLPPLGEG